MRSKLFLFFSAVLLAQGSDSLDPAFDRITFDQWLTERDPGHFRWSVAVPHPVLSFHQRLSALIGIKVDGRDLQDRRGEGELVFFIQITSSNGARFQDHSSVQLSKLDENIKAADLELTQRAFLLPGDYRMSVGLLDTKTGHHSAKQLQFRVPPLRNAIADAWSNLPAVEFAGSEESPDSWYLPTIHGRLQWAESVHAPARLNVILNIAPSVPVPGSRRTHSTDLAALLPTLKVITQAASPSLSVSVKLLDLARRRVAFHQDDVHDLDWPRLKASLGESNTASIDVHSLEQRHHDAQFFVSETRSLLRKSEAPCALVVLTSPVAFESGEDLQPVSLEALPACRVVYIRYREPLELPHPFAQEMEGLRRPGRPMRNRQALPAFDQLGGTLKPLSPKVFDAATPEQMAKALAEIEKSLLAEPRK